MNTIRVVIATLLMSVVVLQPVHAEQRIPKQLMFLSVKDTAKPEMAKFLPLCKEHTVASFRNRLPLLSEVAIVRGYECMTLLIAVTD